MQRLFGLAGLLVFLVSAEAASQPALKSVLVPGGERGDLSVIRAIEQNIRQLFHVSSSPEITSFSEYCGFASAPLCSRTIYFRILCR
jgi:hypothetical protein